MDNSLINLTWDDIKKGCINIVNDLKKDLFEPDVVLTILRGGAIPSVIISHMIGARDIATITIKRTESDEVMSKKTQPIIDQNFNYATLTNKKVLIVDDILGSGETLSALLQKLKNVGVTDIKTSVIVVNLNNYEKSPLYEKVQIDYVGQKVRGWVIFPWEN